MANSQTQYAGAMSDTAPLPDAASVSKRPPMEVIAYFIALIIGLLAIYWALLFRRTKSVSTDQEPLPGFGSWADDPRSDEEITAEIRNLRYTRPDKDYSF